MPDTAVIPSPSQAIAASLSGDLIPSKPAVIEAPTQPAAPEPKPAKVDPPTKTGLAAELDALPNEPAVKPVEKAPVDEPHEGEKPAAYIKRLKSERADIANQLTQAKEQLAKRNGDADPEAMKQLRAQLEEANNAVELKAWEHSRAFKDNFAKPVEKAETSARELIAKFTEKKGIYEQALALDGKERMEFLREHLEDAAPAAFERLSRVDERRADMAEALKNHRDMAKQHADNQEQNEGAEVLKAFDSRLETVSQKLSPFRGEGAEENIAMARSLLTGEAAASDIIDASFLAVYASKYAIPTLRANAAEIASLKARVAEYEGAAPAINGRGNDGAPKNEVAFKDGRPPDIKAVIDRQIAELTKTG